MERMMTMTKDEIKITHITEHDNGSATVHLDLEPEVFGKIFSAGFVHLIMKGIEGDVRQPTPSVSV